jgi:hypothetical protein
MARPSYQGCQTANQNGDAAASRRAKALAIVRACHDELGEALALLQIFQCVPALGLGHADFVEPLRGRRKAPGLLLYIRHIKPS